MHKRTSGPEYREVARGLYKLAKLYETQGNVKAKSTYKEALRMGTQTMGPDHPHVRDMQEDYDAFVLKMSGQGIKGDSQEYTGLA